MEANRSRTRWTYAEFARLPSEGGMRREVIGGRLVVTPAPGRRHQRILTDLVTSLNAFVRAHDLGEVFAAPLDVLLAEGEYLEPDIVFVSEARSDLLTDRGVEGPPDLVVEITSPATASRDRGIKLETYRAHGVSECWIVDPEEGTIDTLSLPEGETRVLVGDDILRWVPAPDAPGFEMPVRELFGSG